MRQLMAELLFDRPFNSEEKSNTCNPQLAAEVERIRSDPEILTRLAELKRAFLHQDDCLCHGDLATDNVMVTGEQFRVRMVDDSVCLPAAQCSSHSFLWCSGKMCLGGVIVEPLGSLSP